MSNPTKWFHSILGVVVLWAIPLAAGCAVGTSHFERSVSVSNTFENFKLLPDHQYYYSGSPSNPTAVVAIQKVYTLTSPHWHVVKPTERDLRRWIEAMRNTTGSEYNLDPNGAKIFNDQGELIGAWYSVWDFPLLKFITPTEFSISNPMTVFPPSHNDPEKGMFRALFR